MLQLTSAEVLFIKKTLKGCVFIEVFFKYFHHGRASKGFQSIEELSCAQLSKIYIYLRALKCLLSIDKF